MTVACAHRCYATTESHSILTLERHLQHFKSTTLTVSSSRRSWCLSGSSEKRLNQSCHRKGSRLVELMSTGLCLLYSRESHPDELRASFVFPAVDLTHPIQGTPRHGCRATQSWLMVNHYPRVDLPGSQHLSLRRLLH